MRIGITVNNIKTEYEDYTTTQLAMTAVNRGHSVWYINVEDFALRPDDNIYAHAYAIPQRRYRSHTKFLENLRDKKQQSKSEINMNDLDVLLLRNDTNQDAVSRPWAQMAAINFASLALRSNVLVLSDPMGLSVGLTKLYMEYFPERVRPRTLVTRNKKEAKEFIAAEGGYAVIKPLAGSGGHNVFLIRPQDTPNLNQMFDAVAQEGFVIVQEYLEDAVAGSVHASNPSRHLLGVDVHRNIRFHIGYPRIVAQSCRRCRWQLNRETLQRVFIDKANLATCPLSQFIGYRCRIPHAAVEDDNETFSVRWGCRDG